MFDLDMSDVICFGSYTIPTLISRRVAGEGCVLYPTVFNF